MIQEEFNKIYTAFQSLNPSDSDCKTFISNLEKEEGMSIPKDWITSFSAKGSLTEFEEKVKKFIIEQLKKKLDPEKLDPEQIKEITSDILELVSDKMIPKTLIDECEVQLQAKIKELRSKNMIDEVSGVSEALIIFHNLSK